MRRTTVALSVCVGRAALLAANPPARAAIRALIRPRSHTVASRLAQYGDLARARMTPAFARAGVAYPPKAVTLVGLKQERLLEVYAGPHPDSLVLVLTYPVRRASGQLGPKLQEGDKQVPEGLYQLESLNPNSRFHLALRVNYPNEFDRRQASADGRRHLGGDIMIHGKASSIGCLAMGDAAAEDLFVLAAETGLPSITVILSPIDFRRRAMPPALPALPSWAPSLYSSIASALQQLPLAPPRTAS